MRRQGQCLKLHKALTESDRYELRHADSVLEQVRLGQRRCSLWIEDLTSTGWAKLQGNRVAGG